jgi:hypoxanthine phosphoribosyltransferase
VIHAELLPEVAERDVLLVDDIFDTGRTLEALVAQVRSLRPRSLRSAVLLRKLGRQEVAIKPDYVAFEIPDVFVVGYGLDYQDAYRHLPYLAQLDEQDVADRAGASQDGARQDGAERRAARQGETHRA